MTQIFLQQYLQTLILLQDNMKVSNKQKKNLV